MTKNIGYRTQRLQHDNLAEMSTQKRCRYVKKILFSSLSFESTLHRPYSCGFVDAEASVNANPKNKKAAGIMLLALFTFGIFKDIEFQILERHYS